MLWIFVLIFTNLVALGSIITPFIQTKKKYQSSTFWSVQVASTSPLLNSDLLNVIVDGTKVRDGELVLLKDETDPESNGIYLYSNNKLIRQNIMPYSCVVVQEGATYRNKAFTNDTTGFFTVQSDLGVGFASTSDLTEGTQRYHTIERVRESLSVSDSLTFAEGFLQMPLPTVLRRKAVISGDGSRNSILQYYSGGSSFTTGLDAKDNGKYKITRSTAIDLYPVLTLDPNYASLTYAWTARNQGALGYAFEEVCWSPELRLFCTVSADITTAAVATSPDGITWTARTAAANGPWRSVCWSSSLNLFCAVGESSGAGSQAMTSSDGITWTVRSTPNSATWQSICWSPERSLFCAVASAATPSDALIMTSSDGINWTSRTSPVVASLQSVVWAAGLGLFCAVGFSGAILTSPDGVLWTAQTGPNNNDWRALAWSPELGMFCAAWYASSGQPLFMTSMNGIDWVMQTYAYAGSATPNTIVWSREFGMFCVLGSFSIALFSSDGINWVENGTFNLRRSVCWSAELGIFVSVGQSSTIANRIATSNSRFDNTPSAILDANVGIGVNNASAINARLQLAGGGVALNSGQTNTATRPALSSTVGPAEIRGHSSTFANDDGWLEISAGGGTNTNAQSTIELSGSSSVADMDRTIVMRTAGVERFRINNTGAAVLSGSLTCGAATVTSLNAGSGAIQTTGTLSTGAATVASLNAGSGTIQTTGTVSAATVTANQIRLATLGGTPTDLNYYEETAGVSTLWNGGYIEAQQSRIHYVRIGNIVSMYFEPFGGEMPGPNSTFTNSLPLRFVPSTTRNARLQVIVNSSTVTGSCTIGSDGFIYVYANPNQGLFPGSLNNGVAQTVVTYHLNG